jgi:uncharacterized protein YecT (DUF1311 family)
MKLKKTFKTKSCSIYVIILCLMGSYVDPPAIAQSKVDPCNPSLSRSNAEEKNCANRASEVADNKLNKVYKQIYSKLSRAEKKQLIKAQSNWIKFRDDNCRFEVEMNRGGTGYGAFLSTCTKRMTGARTKELENWRDGNN